MLIITYHKTAAAQDNFGWLANKLGVSRDDIVTASFPGSQPGDEFAVIGFLASTKALPASA
jgi:hypothetical protein